MSARADWMAGRERPVSIVCAFREEHEAERFKADRVADGTPEDWLDIWPYTCKCCDEPAWGLAIHTVATRRELFKLAKATAALAGDGGLLGATVFFDEPDVERLDARQLLNPARRHHDDRQRSRRKRRRGEQ